MRLAEGATFSRQVIMKHLQVLEEARLARSSRAASNALWTHRPISLLGRTAYG